MTIDTIRLWRERAEKIHRKKWDLANMGTLTEAKELAEEIRSLSLYPLESAAASFFAQAQSKSFDDNKLAVLHTDFYRLLRILRDEEVRFTI